MSQLKIHLRRRIETILCAVMVLMATSGAALAQARVCNTGNAELLYAKAYDTRNLQVQGWFSLAPGACMRDTSFGFWLAFIQRNSAGERFVVDYGVSRPPHAYHSRRHFCVDHGGRFTHNMFSSSSCPSGFDLVQFSLQVPLRDGGLLGAFTRIDIPSRANIVPEPAPAPPAPAPSASTQPDLTPRPAAETRVLGVIFDDSYERVRVVGVYSGSPAEQAGLKPGDVIWSLQGAMPRQRADIAAAIAASGPAGIKLSVIRDKREIVEMVVHPEVWPPAQASNPALAGAIVLSLSDAVPSEADRWGEWSCAQGEQAVLCASHSYPLVRCHHVLEEPEALELHEVFHLQDALVELNSSDRGFDVAWYAIRPEPDGSYTYRGLSAEFELVEPPSQQRLEEIASECAEQEVLREKSVFWQNISLAIRLSRSAVGSSGPLSPDMRELDGDEVASVLEDLGIDLPPGCAAGLCRAQIRALWPTDAGRGLVGLMSVRLPSSESMPAWRDILVDLGDDAGGILLDGKGAPIIKFFRDLPQERARIADPLQALEYLELFMSSVSGPGGTFRLLASPRDLLPQIGAPSGAAEEIEQAASLLGDGPEVVPDSDTAGAWNVTTPLVNDGRIWRARLRVEPDFRVTMQDDTVLTEQLPLAKDIYLHGTRVRLGARP